MSTNISDKERELMAEICRLQSMLPADYAEKLEEQQSVIDGLRTELAAGKHEVEWFAAIEHALCVIEHALCAIHGCVATDLPDAVVTNTSWRIDHTPEMAQLAVLKAAFDAAMQGETGDMKQDAALRLALEALNWHYEACDRFVPLVSAQAITAIQELAK